MLQNNLSVKILAVVIAIGLWAYVAYEINPVTDRTFRNVPVKIVNQQELRSRGLALSDSGEYTIDVTVTGNRTVVTSMKADNISATVDVSKCAYGENVINPDISTSKNVEIVADKTTNVTVHVDNYVTKTKDIKVKYDETPEDGYKVSENNISATSVEVSGAKKLVDSVSYVKATVDSDKLNSKYKVIEASLIPVNRQDAEVENVSMSEKTITVSAAKFFTKTVNLTVNPTGQLPAGYKLSKIEAPQTVDIMGDKDQLDGISEVTATGISLDNLTETTEFPLTVDLKDNITLASDSAKQVVKVIITGSRVQDFTISNNSINIIGEDDTKTATILTDSIDVSVSSEKGDIKASDIVASVDISELEAGEHTVRVSLKCSRTSEDISCNPGEVTVRVDVTDAGAGTDTGSETGTDDGTPADDTNTGETGN